jgi:DNA-binding CsgD family transcriptional regulator
VTDPIRVFIGSGSTEERAELVAKATSHARWVVVGDPARADLVVISPEEWSRLARPAAIDRAPRARSLDRPLEGLTPREHEVLTLLADGLPNRDIAARLGVSEHTVKFHLGAIFGKLGASTRTEAVQKGLKSGVIDL